MIVISEPRQIILKAKSKRNKSNTYKKVFAKAKTAQGFIRQGFKRDIKKLRKLIDPDDLMSAIEIKDFARAMRAIPLSQTAINFKDSYEDLKKLYHEAAELSIKALPPPEQRELRWDIKNPRIERYIESRTGNLVQNINSDTQSVIQRAVSNSFSGALTPREVAASIRDHIGLNERQSVALMNYQSNLMERIRDPYTPEKIDDLVSRYADRLLDQRAMNIARTETRAATNSGQLEVWQEAAAQGLIDKKTTRKVYVVDGNPCEICEPMDGQSVGLDEPFVTDDGEEFDYPPVHPNCMCGVELEFVEDEDAQES